MANRRSQVRLLRKIGIILFPLVFQGLIYTVCSAEWTKDMASIRQAAEGIESISADFVQEKRLPILKAPLVSQGRLYYQSPDSLRWEYTAPIKTVMMSYKGEGQNFLWSDDHWIQDLGKGVITQEIILSEVSKWLKGQYTDQSSFSVELVSGPPAKVILSPKQELKPFINRIELTFDKTPGIIKTVEIFETGEASTRIEFNNFKVNEMLSPPFFKQP